MMIADYSPPTAIPTKGRESTPVSAANTPASVSEHYRERSEHYREARALP